MNKERWCQHTLAMEADMCVVSKPEVEVLYGQFKENLSRRKEAYCLCDQQ